MQTNVVALYSYTHTRASLFNTVSSLVYECENESSLSLADYPVKTLIMQTWVSWGNPVSRRERIAIYAPWPIYFSTFSSFSPLCVHLCICFISLVTCCIFSYLKSSRIQVMKSLHLILWPFRMAAHRCVFIHMSDPVFDSSNAAMSS